MAIITLTTDFGVRDWFVGSMKGVILGINPQTQIVDITHEIPAGDVRAGAFALMAACRCFPRLAVHVAVVDPAVGSERAAIAVRTADYFFVGPDNGVLSFALARETVLEIRRIENEAYFRKPVSATFHGRDIFAPVAARLTQGILLDSLGRKLDDFVRLPWPQRGEVMYIDRFGNAITNINVRPARVRVGGRQLPVVNYYQQGRPNEPVGLMGSSGFLEIAINGGNAAQLLGLRIGDPVEAR
jgi:S-adenosylmethionine hydrolase